jgi:3-(3-hydroxy-phenyl)propionate hydroxylase
MTQTNDIDLIIIGLGPVGGTAANVAAAYGLRTVAIDTSTDVHGLPRAIHFDADAMRIFQAAGLADDMLAITRPARGSVHLGMDGEPIREFRVATGVGDLGWNPHYMFYQPELDGLLRRRAEQNDQVDVRLGWSSERVENIEDGVEVAIRSTAGETDLLRARYVLACDGAWSPTREQFGIKLFDYGFEEPWIIVDLVVPDDDLGPDHMTMFCDPKRPGTYVPGPGRHRRWEFMILPGEEGESLRRPDVVRSLIEPVAPWLDLGAAEVVRSAVYRFHGLVADAWSAGNVFLAGDAVHQTPPFYGQGMCHGIRDVRNLIWKLQTVLSGRASGELLSTYQLEREPHVRAIIEAAVENGRYICTLDPELAARRDDEYRERMRSGADVGSFRSVIPGLAAGLLDPASRDLGSKHAGGAGVGGLFPQPWVTHDGQTMPFDELLGLGFAAVTLDEIPTDLGWFTDELGGSVVQAPSDLRPWLNEHRCRWALVRPDRYVFGLADDVGDFRTLAGRLRELLVANGSFVLPATPNPSEATAAEPVGP